MTRNSDILKLVEISRLYYEDGFTQADIAKKLHISRPAISRHLSEARTLGIVKIEIKSPFESNQKMLMELSKKYGFTGGLVVQTGSASSELKKLMFVSQATRYIESTIQNASNIGVSWGEDTGSIVEELAPSTENNISKGAICPLIGSAPNDIKWFQTNELTRVLGNKISYRPHYLMAPAFPGSIENKRLFEQTDEYQIILSLWEKLDLVIMGIGTYPSVPDQATAARFGSKLREEGAVGMMATYYFNKKGQFINNDTDIVIRIPQELLRKVPKKLIIGYGFEKVNSVIGALNTGLITHLITDEEMALKILESD